MNDQATDIARLLERALALAPAQRRRLLDRECAGDPATRERLVRLLDFSESDDGFLDRPPHRLQVDAEDESSLHQAGSLIGSYRLQRRIGAGGSAEVWLAQRAEGGFEQDVAVKIVRDAQGTSRDRMEAECEILASLSHPGIARLHDGGVERNGFAYMIMEYVEGEHLVAYATKHSLTLQERLGLFVQVCDAVAYAHTRLVVHRDLKPSNILVAADRQVKLLDFGIAKLLGSNLASDVTRTVHLSPAYAAPEQLLGELVGTSTDVYALGVTLFELLTGRLPWSDDGRLLATAVKRLVDEPKPLPSRAVPADSPIPSRALRGDLDAIVARAMRKEPGARYPDARMLGDDVRRHLDHKPVRAREGVHTYVLRRFVRRQWLPLAGAATVFLALTIALFAIAWQARKVTVEASRTAAVQAFMVDLFRTNSVHQPDPLKARQTTVRELLDIGVKRVESSFGDVPESKLALWRLFGDLYDEIGLPVEQMLARRQAIALSRQLYGDDSTELVGDLIAAVKNDTDRAESERFLDEARAILDRRNDRRSFLRGRLLSAFAGHHYTTRIPQALGEAEEAVAILSRYPDSPELANALYMRGMAETYAGNVSAALEPLRRAVEVSIAVEGNTGAMLSTYYKQLGETQAAAQDYASAEASVRHALELAQADTSEIKADVARAQAALAVILANADRPRDALELASTALAHAPSADDGNKGDIQLRAYVLGTLSRSQARAGDPEPALENAASAVQLARRFDPSGTSLVAALQSQAGAMAELGQSADADRVLGEAAEILKRTRPAPSELTSMLQIRVALDEGRQDDARTLLAALPALNGDSLESTNKAIRRDIVRAQVELADGNNGEAVRIAADAAERARKSSLAPYLRSATSDALLIEGLGSVRSDDPGQDCSLLGTALATRSALYLPQSPRIAEAEVALAECELARGRAPDAVRLVASAKAIYARHGALSRRYREPLQRISAALDRERLAQRSEPTRR